MKGYLLLTLSTLIVGIAIAMSGVLAQDNSAPNKQQKVDKTEFESQFPITESNKPEPSDQDKRARWQAKGKKYRGIGPHVTEDSDFITINNEWDVGLQALPVTKSDLIVIGEATDAQSFLTSEKDWVYSEFVIQIDEVLKNTGNVRLTQGSSLVVSRDGGRVRFPNGHVVLEYIPGQGMPRVGRRYTLFLTKDQEQAFHILTGYELSAGRVLPIDNPAGGRHPIATVYKNADESSFLNDLRAAIANSQ